MPARTLAFASLMLATGLNTVVGNSDAEATACSNGGLSTFCANACPPSATTCGKQLDGSTRLTGATATAPGSCAACAANTAAATGADDCMSTLTLDDGGSVAVCGNQFPVSDPVFGDMTLPRDYTNNACADCTTGWAATGTDDCIAHTTCGYQADGTTTRLLAAGTATADTSCAACAANTAAETDAQDCVGGACGYQWNGDVRKMKLNLGNPVTINNQAYIEPNWFGCEPCTASTSSVLPDGTDTGFCVPETCRQTLNIGF